MENASKVGWALAMHLPAIFNFGDVCVCEMEVWEERYLILGNFYTYLV